MPTKQISNPAGVFGQPLFASAGENEQLLVEVVNNTGGPILQGMVMCWDVFTALNTTTPVAVSGNQSGTVAAFTLTAGASTASYPSAGLLVIPDVVFAATGIGALNNFVGQAAVYYGAITGSTFTGAQVPFATATSGIKTLKKIWPTPSASPTPPQQVGLPAIATASDSGRLVTFSTLTGSSVLAGLDPLVAGVCSPTGDAGTNGQIIYPGQPFLLCVGGVARVNVAGNSVAALANLCTAATGVGSADDLTPTIGNLLGISLESQAAKDVNNTIRAIIRLG